MYTYEVFTLRLFQKSFSLAEPSSPSLLASPHVVGASRPFPRRLGAPPKGFQSTQTSPASEFLKRECKCLLSCLFISQGMKKRSPLYPHRTSHSAGDVKLKYLVAKNEHSH